MRKSEKEFIAVFAGIVLIFTGIIVMSGAMAGNWTIEVVGSRITRIVVGGFVFVIGAVFLAFGIGEDITDFIESVWDRFLEALGR